MGSGLLFKFTGDDKFNKTLVTQNKKNYTRLLKPQNILKRKSHLFVHFSIFSLPKKPTWFLPKVK